MIKIHVLFFAVSACTRCFSANRKRYKAQIAVDDGPFKRVIKICVQLFFVDTRALYKGQTRRALSKKFPLMIGPSKV